MPHGNTKHDEKPLFYYQNMNGDVFEIVKIRYCDFITMYGIYIY